MLHTILKFLVSLFSALSRAEDASTSDPVSTVDTQSAAPPGWEGAPPYRYIDVSRYQGTIDWAQVATTRVVLPATLQGESQGNFYQERL